MAIAVPQREETPVPSSVSAVLSTIPIWWGRRAAAAGLSPAWQDWRLALSEPPLPVTWLSAPEPELEDATATEIGEAYVRGLDPSTRLRQGRHYTPDLLADVLRQEIEAAGFAGGQVVDPACGAGALLLEPLRTVIADCRDTGRVFDEALQLVSGTDLDPLAVWLGNALLGAELLPHWSGLPERNRRRLPELLRVADGLSPADDRPQLIVMNPPYGRVRLDGAERHRWRESLYGHANRYALFLHAAIERVDDDGLVAAVLPTSFLGGSYYRLLRSFITEHAPLVRLTFVDARAGVFNGDVLQETCLAVFRKGAAPPTVACARLAVNGSLRSDRLPSVASPDKSTVPWLMPRSTRDGALIEASAQLDARLPDYGWEASTGPLVWNRHKPQLFSSPGSGRLPILWAADVEPGAVSWSDARAHRRWIALRPADEFMTLTEPAILVQRTTAPEQPRRLVAAHLSSDALAAWGGSVVVENHVNVLRCTDAASPLTMELLERLLRTPTLDRLYRCLTGTVAVSAYELAALPLPSFDVLVEWQSLAAGLSEAVARHYGDEPS